MLFNLDSSLITGLFSLFIFHLIIFLVILFNVRLFIGFTFLQVLLCFFLSFHLFITVDLYFVDQVYQHSCLYGEIYQSICPEEAELYQSLIHFKKRSQTCFTKQVVLWFFDQLNQHNKFTIYYEDLLKLIKILFLNYFILLNYSFNICIVFNLITNLSDWTQKTFENNRASRWYVIKQFGCCCRENIERLVV